MINDTLTQTHARQRKKFTQTTGDCDLTFLMCLPLNGYQGGQKDDEDEDFTASEDSDDEEETIAKQEKREKGNYKAEIDELQAEGNSKNLCVTCIRKYFAYLMAYLYIWDS